MTPLADEYPETKYANPECEDCEGEGRIYNNHDKTCGQWVACECVSSKAMVNVDDLIKRLIAYMKDNPGECGNHERMPWLRIYATINSAEKFYPESKREEE